MSGTLCHGICVCVRKRFIPVNYRTNALIDWSNFSVAYWGWLEECSFRWSAPPLIQDGRYGRHLGFGFRRLENKRLGRLIPFFYGLLGVTWGRFISIISSATHPSWPLRSPSSIWLPSIRGHTPVSIDPIFLWLIRGVGEGVNTGRFLSMTSSADHPWWPLRPPSWIWFPSIILIGCYGFSNLSSSFRLFNYNHGIIYNWKIYVRGNTPTSTN
jgi:hypothetical protein